MSEQNTKFTPGPWQVAEAGSWNKGIRTSQEFFVRRPDDDVGIASDIIDPATSNPSEANAALIAAAPELYAAVEALMLEYDTANEVLPAHFQAIAALKKARGES